jgi:solute carrier family 12 sodium/potassium/chloride transporter 2
LQGKLTYKLRRGLIERGNHWLHERQKIKAFYTVVDGCGFEDGARALIQATGLGKMRPNILLMGYKCDWTTCNTDDLKNYFTVLQ